VLWLEGREAASTMRGSHKVFQSPGFSLATDDDFAA
jgi:hypothetical protein